MSNVLVLLTQVKALSTQEQEELLSQLEDFVVLDSQAKQKTKEVKKMKFSNGWVEKERIRSKNLLVHSNILHKYTRIKEFKNITPNFV